MQRGLPLFETCHQGVPAEGPFIMLSNFGQPL